METYSQDEFIEMLSEKEESLREQGRMCIRQANALKETIVLLLGQQETQGEGKTIRPQDFSSARNLAERLTIVAEAWGGVVNTTKAADALLEAGVSEARRRNLVVSVHRELHWSSEWEKVGPGTYRWIFFGRPPLRVVHGEHFRNSVQLAALSAQVGKVEKEGSLSTVPVSKIFVELSKRGLRLDSRDVRRHVEGRLFEEGAAFERVDAGEYKFIGKALPSESALEEGWDVLLQEISVDKP